MKQVVGRNVSLLPIAEGNMLPLILPKAVCREATSKGAMPLLNEVQLELQAKIVNLDLINHTDPEYAAFLEEKLKTAWKKMRMMTMRDKKRKIVVVNNNGFNASKVVIMMYYLQVQASCARNSRGSKLADNF
jgi:hypothetical protein